MLYLAASKALRQNIPIIGSPKIIIIRIGYVFCIIYMLYFELNNCPCKLRNRYSTKLFWKYIKLFRVGHEIVNEIPTNSMHGICISVHVFLFNITRWRQYLLFCFILLPLLISAIFFTLKLRRKYIKYTAWFERCIAKMSLNVQKYFTS